jgi:hypothetical protein
MLIVLMFLWYHSECAQNETNVFYPTHHMISHRAIIIAKSDSSILASKIAIQVSRAYKSLAFLKAARATSLASSVLCPALNASFRAG